MSDRLPVITALGLLTPFGLGVDPFVTAWRAGLSAPRVDDGPMIGGVLVGDVPLRDAFPGGRALMRRMDRLSRMICMAGALARDDAGGVGEIEELALGVGTDLGTLEETWAFLCRLRDKGPELANPNDFPNLVPNAGAGYLGTLMGARGPSHTFCQHDTCGDDAVAWVADGVLAGWFPAGLGGGAEELGPIRAAAMERTGCPVPLGPASEGAAFVLLEQRARAIARGAVPRCVHRGSWGAAGLRHGSPLRREVDAVALAELIALAVERAGLSADDVGLALLSHPQDEGLRAGLRAGLGGRDVPQTDHDARLGVHPADGALRVALGALLLADASLPVNRDGAERSGPAALVVSGGRGGGLRVSVLTEA